MTAQILANELNNLIQESRRKNGDLRSEAEKSLQDLRSLRATSEAQLATDLNRRPQFIDPFIHACETRNSKYAGPAVVCLQRLAVSGGLPKERLKDVMDGLKECSSLGLDVHLKILQTLPALIQNYSKSLRGQLLFGVLEICASLQGIKNPAVSSSAAATLQQLLSSLFESVAIEDQKALELPTVTEIPGPDGPIALRAAAYDTYRVLQDLCLYIEGKATTDVRFSPIGPIARLELLETILTGHTSVLLSHPELGMLLRSFVMPSIINSLSERLDFPVTVRVIRIANSIIRNYLPITPSESEIVLSLMNHMLEPDASAPWKRALCMEVFRGIYSDAGLLLDIYSRYDDIEGQKSIIQDNLTAMVRVSSEKPSAIGHSYQSSSHKSQNVQRDIPAEQVAVQAGAVAGLIGTVGSEAVTQGPGISSQWSSVKTSCLDQLEKSEPPQLPETYVYSLVLTCINQLSEGLAKVVLPLTVAPEARSRRKEPSTEHPKEKLARSQSYRKRTVPVNPLTLENHPSYPAVKTIASCINQSWPALLASCSTFLYATLDVDFYRSLVRSIQRLTQVAGLLDLTTPRDALLTMLARAAVPANMAAQKLNVPQTPTTPSSPRTWTGSKGLLSVDSLVGQSSGAGDKGRRPSVEVSRPALTARNLLCLRALLNVGIALGPTLGGSWKILFETLQQADLIMTTSPPRGASSQEAREPSQMAGAPESQFYTQDLNTEINAVQAAAARLLESSVDFPDNAFLDILTAICALLHPKSSNTQNPPSTPTSPPGHQRRMASFSGISYSTTTQNQNRESALGKLGDLASLNLRRFLSLDPRETGWELLASELTTLAVNDEIPKRLRLMATEIVNRCVQDMAVASISEEGEARNTIQSRALSTLDALTRRLYGLDQLGRAEADEADLDVHGVALESLRSVLERCGDTLEAGWDATFSILESVFEPEEPNNGPKYEQLAHRPRSASSTELISVRLARTAFGSTQLICSDFLASVPQNTIPNLLTLLYQFCAQADDLNLALTAMTVFWALSDFLQDRLEEATLDVFVDTIKDSQEVSKHIEESAAQQDAAALWFCLLLRLVTVTENARPEVKNGALHMISRIFANCGDRMSPKVWSLCLRAIFMPVFRQNREQQTRARAAQPSGSEMKTLNESTQLMMDVFSKAFAENFETIVKVPDFTTLWHRIVTAFEAFLSLDDYPVIAATWNAVDTVIGKAKSSSDFGDGGIEKVWSMWTSKCPTDAHPDSGGDNQSAYLAYVSSLKCLYRLVNATLDVQGITHISKNLEQCVRTSTQPSYVADVNTQTALQTQVSECIGIMKTDTPGVPSIITKLLATLVMLAFDKVDSQGSIPRGLTYVALSKASMDTLESVIIRHAADKALFTSGALLGALQSLARPISLKHNFQAQGKSPALWQKATATSLAILGAIFAAAKQQSIPPEHLNPLWTLSTSIADGIARANTTTIPADASVSDEDFDITSLRQLNRIIIPSLGSPSIPQTIRRAYTSSLFRNSLLHALEPYELPTLDTAPLSSLYKIRLGRVYEPECTPRARMSYFCLSHLLSLVARHDTGNADNADEEDAARIKLAQAAAPYLILRAALPLKTYIADQPLRGRLPMPQSQRREVLCVLRRMRELESEEEAIPEAEGVRSEGKRHLFRLYPLVIKALGVVGRHDGEIKAELGKLLEGVGEEFGV